LRLTIDAPMVDLDAFGRSLVLEQHHRFFDYWRSKATAGALPSRRSIDPVEIHDLLPWLILFDVTWSEGEPRFRFRLVGTGCVERYGRNASGQWFEETYEGETLLRQSRTYAEVARTGVPHLSRPRFPVSDREFVTYDRLILPLADDGRSVDALVALMVFE